jgi:uncharacterized protein (TIGR02145 family)
MKNLYIALALLISGTALGQIEQNVNKTSGTVSNAINDIDSIRFNAGQTEMQIILNNGTAVNHAISDINNVTFSGQASAPIWPVGTVHCTAVPTAIVDVTNPTTGKIWMDRNLGATQVATSITDTNSYGDLHQWGRRSDGHQCRTSPTTATLSSVDQPAHGDYILSPNAPLDWRSPQNINLWQGLNGVNNPCPSGYRLPTETEINAERLSWNANTSEGAFASPLKLPMPGARDRNNGSLLSGGANGYYWSSTVSGANANGTNSRRLSFSSSNAFMVGSYRADGLTVRCIKD